MIYETTQERQNIQDKRRKGKTTFIKDRHNFETVAIATTTTTQTMTIAEMIC